MGDGGVAASWTEAAVAEEGERRVDEDDERNGGKVGRGCRGRTDGDWRRGTAGCSVMNHVS